MAKLKVDITLAGTAARQSEYISYEKQEGGQKVVYHFGKLDYPAVGVELDEEVITAILKEPGVLVTLHRDLTDRTSTPVDGKYTSNPEAPQKALYLNDQGVLQVAGTEIGEDGLPVGVTEEAKKINKEKDAEIEKGRKPEPKKPKAAETAGAEASPSTGVAASAEHA